jgi:hypothetical protein
LRTGKFRLRNEFDSQDPSQAIEIIGHRKQQFRGFMQFQGVTTHVISRFFVSRLFLPARRAWEANSNYQDLLLAQIWFRRKIKRPAGHTVRCDRIMGDRSESSARGS